MDAFPFRRVITPVVCSLLLAAGGTACSAGNEAPRDADTTDAALTGTLTGGGSTAQESAQSTWITALRDANPGLEITYEAVGSGDGRANFINGAYAFGATDSALGEDKGALSAARKRCGGNPIQVPAYVSPIAVVYNLPGVDDLQLDPATVSGIFAGTITSWDDPAITATNPESDLPATPIVPVHRSDNSGTTKNFLSYLAEAGSFPADPASLWPVEGGIAAAGTSGLVGAVSQDEGTIGYADNSATKGMQVARLKVGSAFVVPSAEGAARLLSISRPAGASARDLALDLARATDDPSAYPNVLVSYLLACSTYDDPATARLVKAYLTYVLSEDGQKTAATEARSAPLERDITNRAQLLVDKIA